jgi:hypothetical protein
MAYNECGWVHRNKHCLQLPLVLGLGFNDRGVFLSNWNRRVVKSNLMFCFLPTLELVGPLVSE